MMETLYQISDVTFRNITVLSAGEKCTVSGLKDAKIRNVTFENFTYKGKTIGPLNYRTAFHTMKNSENVRFDASYGGALGRLLNFFAMLWNRLLDLFGV